MEEDGKGVKWEEEWEDKLKQVGEGEAESWINKFRILKHELDETFVENELHTLAASYENYLRRPGKVCFALFCWEQRVFDCPKTHLEDRRKEHKHAPPPYNLHILGSLLP